MTAEYNTMRQAEAFLTTRTEQETAHAGYMFGRVIGVPTVIALEGELGAGKTVFVRGAARGLAVDKHITSPTFVLLKIYSGRLPLYHFDFYRLSAPEESPELDFDEYLPGGGAAFVEWPERLPELLPAEKVVIRLERFYDDRGEGRRILLTPHGADASLLVDRFIESITWRTDGTLNMPQAGEA